MLPTMLRGTISEEQLVALRDAARLQPDSPVMVQIAEHAAAILEARKETRAVRRHAQALVELCGMLTGAVVGTLLGYAATATPEPAEVPPTPFGSLEGRA